MQFPNRFTKRRIIHATAVVFVSGLSINGPIVSNAVAVEVENYNIPAGPLGKTLSAFAASNGIALSFDSSLTDGRTSPGLNGNVSAEEGFRTLLGGSGLEIVRNGDGSYTLKKKPLPIQSYNPVTLPTVNVVDNRDIALRADYAPATTKGSTALIKTPMSVQVIPQAL